MAGFHLRSRAHDQLREQYAPCGQRRRSGDFAEASASVSQRCVGLPGNVIDISEHGELLVNNAIALEDIYYPTYKAENSAVSFPYTVEEGKAFILNDYREDTLDSRSFGTVDLSDIDGPLILSLRRRGF